MTATLLVAAPFGVLLGLLLSSERLDNLPEAPSPLIESPQRLEFDERIGVVVTPLWAESAKLYAPSWGGTVGRVEIQPGVALRSGDPVASVGGIARLAVQTPEPFYRTLGAGDRGADVVWLHEVLRRLGYLGEAPADESVVSTATVRAIGALANALGVPGEVDHFDPTWFVWLPSEPFNVASVDISAGAPAPAAGSVLATGPMRLSRLVIESLEGGPPALGPAVQYVLDLDAVDVPLQIGTTDIAAAYLQEVESILDPSLDSLAGTVRRAESVPVWAVPASAVMSGSDGRLCLWLATAEGFDAIEVEILAARAGVALISPPTTGNSEVVHNPAEILGDPACPSG